MKPFVVALFLWVSGTHLCLGCARVNVETPVVTTHGCAPFELISAPEMGPRAILAVEIRVDGIARRVQLDTGSELSWGYGFETEALSFSLGNLQIKNHPMQGHPPVDNSPAPLGTLGMDFFAGKLVQIDYEASEVCIGQADIANAQFITASSDNNRLVLPFRDEAGGALRLFFDTGTGNAPFILDRDRWRQLTGQAGPEIENKKIAVPTHQEPGQLIGAPSRSTLSLGACMVARGSMLYSANDKSSVQALWPEGVVGLVGNFVFRRAKVIIDARGPSIRFGVVRTQSPTIAGDIHCP